MKWNIEKLIEANETGDATLYFEIIQQLKENGMNEDTTTMQTLRTLIEMSWTVVEYELGQETVFTKAIYDLYYNKDLKEKTLIDILGNDIFDAIYEEIEVTYEVERGKLNEQNVEESFKFESFKTLKDAEYEYGVIQCNEPGRYKCLWQIFIKDGEETKRELLKSEGRKGEIL